MSRRSAADRPIRPTVSPTRINPRAGSHAHKAWGASPVAPPRLRPHQLTPIKPLEQQPGSRHGQLLLGPPGPLPWWDVVGRGGTRWDAVGGPAAGLLPSPHGCSINEATAELLPHSLDSCKDRCAGTQEDARPDGTPQTEETGRTLTDTHTH